MLRILLNPLFTLALASFAITTSTHADNLTLPIGQNLHAQWPQYGDSQQSVLQRYGSPPTQHEAVGTPPIIRWDYAEFSVYFEETVVIHSVTHRASNPVTLTKPVSD